MSDTKRYKRYVDGAGKLTSFFADDEKQKYRTAEEILKEYVGDTRFYTHYWPADNLHAWFFDLPQRSDFQDYFAEAGKMALVVNIDKINKKLGR